MAIYITAKKIKPTWNNIIEYKNDTSLPNHIYIDWLNDQNNYSLLSTQAIPGSFNQTFINDIILTEQISDEAFSHLIKGFNGILQNDTIEDLKVSRARTLIEIKKITLLPATFDSLRLVGDDLHLLLLKANMKDFLRSAASFILSAQDYIKLLNDKLNKNYKNRLIELIEPADVEMDSRLAHAIIRVMLENKNSGKIWNL